MHRGLRRGLRPDRGVLEPHVHVLRQRNAARGSGCPRRHGLRGRVHGARVHIRRAEHSGLAARLRRQDHRGDVHRQRDQHVPVLGRLRCDHAAVRRRRGSLRAPAERRAEELPGAHLRDGRRHQLRRQQGGRRELLGVLRSGLPNRALRADLRRPVRRDGAPDGGQRGGRCDLGGLYAGSPALELAWPAGRAARVGRGVPALVHVRFEPRRGRLGCHSDLLRLLGQGGRGGVHRGVRLGLREKRGAFDVHLPDQRDVPGVGGLPVRADRMRVLLPYWRGCDPHVRGRRLRQQLHVELHQRLQLRVGERTADARMRRRQVLRGHVADLRAQGLHHHPVRQHLQSQQLRWQDLRPELRGGLRGRVDLAGAGPGLRVPGQRQLHGHGPHVRAQRLRRGCRAARDERHRRGGEVQNDHDRADVRGRLRPGLPGRHRDLDLHRSREYNRHAADVLKILLQCKRGHLERERLPRLQRPPGRRHVHRRVRRRVRPALGLPPGVLDVRVEQRVVRRGAPGHGADVRSAGVHHERSGGEPLGAQLRRQNHRAELQRRVQSGLLGHSADVHLPQHQGVRRHPAHVHAARVPRARRAGRGTDWLRQPQVRRDLPRRVRRGLLGLVTGDVDLRLEHRRHHGVPAGQQSRMYPEGVLRGPARRGGVRKRLRGDHHHGHVLRALCDRESEGAPARVDVPEDRRPQWQLPGL
mmetsp:Transcript_52531/g.159647  ORF Transcript_52531/g.159647 Transcript_52531/m.159647 type:complete len:697 (+) Transcript_52531:1363-3453(+)